MILAIINYILVAGVAAVSVLGFINGAGDGYDMFGAGGLPFPILALLFVLWRALASPSKKLGAHYFLWPAALVLVSRTLFPAAAAEWHDAHAALVVASVLLPALLRADLVWLVVFAFAAVSSSALVYFEQREMVAAGGASFYLVTAQLTVAAFLAGFIPWLILRKRNAAQNEEYNKTLEEVRNNAINDGMARARAMPQQDGAKKGAAGPTDTGLVSANTILMDSSSTDTFTLLKDGGDGVNAQLKAMLPFMRYNFKALTACAFIYDSAGRTLALNCHETKGGIQIAEQAQISVGKGNIGQVAADRKLFMSGDLALYGGQPPYYAQNANVSSLIAAPIVWEYWEFKNGARDKKIEEFLGVLVVDSINKNAFNEHDKEVMKKFSSIAAALIKNIQMNLTLEHNAKMFEVYYNISQQFSVALKTDEVFNAIMEKIPSIVPSCMRQIVILHDQETNTLELRHITGTKGELAGAEKWKFPPASGGIYSYAFNNYNNGPVNIPDLQAVKGYRFVSNEPLTPATRSLLVIPIIGGEERRCLGLFSVESDAPGVFGTGAAGDDHPLKKQLTTIIENASVAVTRSLLYLKMEKYATTDGLTGLNNHRTFQEKLAQELERARRSRLPLSLLLTDIDFFKKFNDTHGHPVGDMVLREVAACIRNAVRLNDFPARYGGEEFGVILPETDPNGAFIIADRIRQIIEAHVVDSGTDKLRVTISVGCATIPVHCATQQEIIDCADKALYASKRAGRNCVTVYAPGMTVAAK
ncbi:MAG: diguanylate cyclase [Chitinispirillales bacterium]|jgi:diguanylate cyclase (GGDEF)-like protein|nr:diguanylate cyclase [Chitinispirillales bacterium]